MKKIFSVVLLLMSIVSFAQTEVEPVIWHFETTNLEEDKVELHITAEIFDKFHLYSQDLSEGDGPIPTEFNFNLSGSIEKVGSTEENGAKVHYDETWKKDISSFTKTAEFIQIFNLLNPDSTVINGTIDYMVCNDVGCVFLGEKFSIDLLKGDKIEKIQETSSDTSLLALIPKLANMDITRPIFDNCEVDNLKSTVPDDLTEKKEEESKSYWMLFILGLVGGLVSLITPCVFPMIPLTVSFFTKGGSEKGKGIAKALLYGFSIVAVYVSLSIPFYFGAESEVLSQLSTNFWLNLFFFGIFLFFAFSFFGYYEIGLPSSWANKADKAADLGGFVGVIFMALVLAIVSFSCTGPLLGSVLASSLKDGAVPITVAMLGFGLGLGLPFTLFAAFPSMLKSLPQSGGWLNTVKVVLGFIELALALKFLSNADFVFQYGVVLRETFFLVWIIISLATALYLFGLFRFPHDGPKAKIGKSRMIIGLVFLSFTVYLSPGILTQKSQPWSHGMISGFPPPYWYGWYASDASTLGGISLDIEDENLENEAKLISDLDVLIDFIEENNKEEIKIHYHITDYYVGRQYAQKVNRPMLFDFTGYACVNCRRMEENVWTQKGVKEVLERDYIVISLYVDDKNELPKEQQGPIPITQPDGTIKQKELVTIGDRWANFSIIKFGQMAQPYYALLSPDEYLLNTPVAYTPDVEEYAHWLQCGLKAFEELQIKKKNNELSEIEGGKEVATEIIEPITWSFSAVSLGNHEYELNLDGIIEEGWHTYSTTLPMSDEGPLGSWITFEESDNYELIDGITEENAHSYFDETWKMDIVDFSEEAIFKQKIKTTGSDEFLLKGNINFMVCKDGACLPPEDAPFEIKITP
jgi:thiol:disulfide interchange protein